MSNGSIKKKKVVRSRKRAARKNERREAANARNRKQWKRKQERLKKRKGEDYSPTVYKTKSGEGTYHRYKGDAEKASAKRRRGATKEISKAGGGTKTVRRKKR